MEALIDSSLESIQGKNGSDNEKEEEIKEIESLLEELREKVWFITLTLFANIFGP